jgi:hypothetical protein
MTGARRTTKGTARKPGVVNAIVRFSLSLASASSTAPWASSVRLANTCGTLK